jgi:hypothetical protein
MTYLKFHQQLADSSFKKKAKTDIASLPLSTDDETVSMLFVVVRFRKNT